VSGHEYAGVLDVVFHGDIDDIRIVNRPLGRKRFLRAE
jgi:hypothetical protein